MFDFSGYPLARIQQLRKLDPETKNAITRELSHGCPIKPWPYAMPCSAAPLIVTVGFSPGDSPSAQDADQNPLATEPPTFGTVHPLFYYEDTKGFWKKIRALHRKLVQREGYIGQITEADALSLASHFNLGVERAGSASSGSLNAEIATWVSGLLNVSLDPKVIVLVGLKGILRGSQVPFSLGNIDWHVPDITLPFSGFKGSFDVWTRNLGKKNAPTAIVMWPNHPSRVPFGAGNKGYNNWLLAVDQVVVILKQLKL